MRSRYLVSNFTCNLLRVSDIRIKEINLSLCPPLRILALNRCKQILLSLFLQSSSSLFSSLLLCFTLQLLVQIVEHVEIVADIKRTVCVYNGIMRLAFNHSTLVIMRYSLLRRMLDTKVMLFALDIDNISYNMMFA